MLKRIIIFISVAVMTVLSGFQAFCLESGDLSAVSAVLYYPEYETVLFGKNPTSQLSMASTTKIMTSLIALEECTPDRVVEITAEMVNVEGSSSGLSAGDKITLRDLVYCMMLESGNDAANSVAIALGGSFEGFAEMMNKRAAEIGMKNTSFVTPSGLDDENHYTTAYDMALLASEALLDRDFYSISKETSRKISFIDSDKSVTLHNHNRLLSEYDGCIGIKTGFTKKSGRCLVSAAEKNGVTLIAVTLNAGDDWNDHRKMLDYGFSCVDSTEADSDFSHYSVRITGGAEKTVSVESNAVSVNFLKDENCNITRKVYLEKFLYAPVKKGDKIGFAEYYNGDKLIKTVSLTAENDVAVGENQKKENLLDRLLGLFDSWWKNG